MQLLTIIFILFFIDLYLNFIIPKAFGYALLKFRIPMGVFLARLLKNFLLASTLFLFVQTTHYHLGFTIIASSFYLLSILLEWLNFRIRIRLDFKSSGSNSSYDYLLFDMDKKSLRLSIILLLIPGIFILIPDLAIDWFFSLISKTFQRVVIWEQEESWGNFIQPIIAGLFLIKLAYQTLIEVKLIKKALEAGVFNKN